MHDSVFEREAQNAGYSGGMEEYRMQDTVVEWRSIECRIQYWNGGV